MTPPPDVVAKIAALPMGTTTGTAFDKRYVTSRSTFGAGKATKVVAEELGGTDYISLNLYDLSAGPALFPCEMPAQKVIDFVRAYLPDAQSKAD